MWTINRTIIVSGVAVILPLVSFLKFIIIIIIIIIVIVIVIVIIIIIIIINSGI